MKSANFKWGILIVSVTLIGPIAGYFARDYLPPVADAVHTAGHEPGPASAAADERKVLYWYDPMFPLQQFEQPGKSPFMDMQLVPKYADEEDAATTVMIDPGQIQNIGMRLATVTRGIFTAEINAVGTLSYNDRDVAIVQTRTSGFVEKVYARAPSDVVETGAPLVDILAPEWAAAQTEFLALIKTGEIALINAARERLKLLGMSTALIGRVETRGETQPIITVSTPIAGVIQTLDVRAGMTVMAGQTLARINGLTTVWLDVAVPLAQGGQVRVGDQVEARFTAYPGEIFKGEVIALLPEINPDSRTLRVRIELANPDGRFRPGMYAEVKLREAEQQSVLQVPSEAVIRTGRRSLVMLSEDNGRYRPVEVEIGREMDGQTVVLKGLEEGQQVVASGQFLIDSEANLRGILSRPVKPMEMTGEQP